MPTYVYKFIDTGETIEVQQAFTDDALTEATHPATGENLTVKKVFTPVGVTFKGGGFYKTDSRGGKSKSSSTSPTSRVRRRHRRRPSTSSERVDEQLDRRRRRRPPPPTEDGSQLRLNRADRPIQSAATSPNRSTRFVAGGRMHLLAWVRLMVARHPWAYWVAIAVVAGAVALGAAQAMAGVDAERRSWGDQQDGVDGDCAAVDPGQPIRAERRSVPRAVVPLGAVTVAPDDAVARQRIAVGEIITDLDVAAAGPAGLIPDGWVAFAVPSAVGHFAAGDDVRVYAGDQFVAAGVVVDAGESDVMVAIPVDAAPTMSTGHPRRRRDHRPRLGPVTAAPDARHVIRRWRSIRDLSRASASWWRR